MRNKVATTATFEQDLPGRTNIRILTADLEDFESLKVRLGHSLFFVCAILGAYLINSRIRLPRKRRGTYSATNLTISLSTLLSVTVLLTILAMREYNAVI